MKQNEKMNSETFNEIESNSINGWIPRTTLQPFLGLKDTSMCAFQKKYNVKASKIGRLTFYWAEDIHKLLENNSNQTS